MQNVGRSHITNFDPLVRAIAQAQPLFETLGDKMLLAGFELPGEMYDTLDSAVIVTGEIQFAVAQQNELMSQLGNQIGILPDGVIAGIQGLSMMLEGSLGYIGEVQFQSVCTLLDLLQVSELTAKASAQMLTLMAQDTGDDGFLETLFGGIGVATGVAGVASVAGAAGSTLSLGSLGGPLGIGLALAALATMTAVGVGVNNANKTKKRMEAAEEVASPIGKLNYSDEGRRSAQYRTLVDDRYSWRESMEQSQALTQLQPFTCDTAATDTMIELLRKLVDKPINRVVNSEVVVQSLRTNQTLSEFREMFVELLKHDREILP